MRHLGCRILKFPRTNFQWNRNCLYFIYSKKETTQYCNDNEQWIANWKVMEMTTNLTPSVVPKRFKMWPITLKTFYNLSFQVFLHIVHFSYRMPKLKVPKFSFDTCMTKFPVVGVNTPSRLHSRIEEYPYKCFSKLSILNLRLFLSSPMSNWTIAYDITSKA